MTRTASGSYNGAVLASRLRSWGTVAAGALGFVFALIISEPAAADPLLYGVGNSPVVNVNIDGGTLSIKTWDRQAVQTESTTPVAVHQFGPQAVSRALGKEIPVLASSIDTQQHGQITLPEETFVLSSVSEAPHDAVVIRSSGDTTITIPASTALVVARGHGFVTVDGYRNGTFFVRLQGGGVHLENDGGEGFVQVMRGGIYANDSSFNRLRARTGQGGILFERCHARQIQATSIAGSVVYDNSSFEPGLARFETAYGHVAIGVSGNAQIGAHSASGHIFTNFDRRANVESGSNDATAVLGPGGATVTASAGGAVLLYDGTMMTRTGNNLNPVWRGMREAFTRIQGRVAPAAMPSQRVVNPQTHGMPRMPRGHRGRPPGAF